MLEVVERVEFDLVRPLGCGTGEEVKEDDNCWGSTVELCLDRLAGKCGGKEGMVLGVAHPVEGGPDEGGEA